MFQYIEVDKLDLDMIWVFFNFSITIHGIYKQV